VQEFENARGKESTGLAMVDSSLPRGFSVRCVSPC